MRQSGAINLIAGLGLVAASAGAASAGWPGDPAKCRKDAVKAGSVCMDKYEASVWEVPATSPSGRSNLGLKKQIQDGKARYAHLIAGGAIQRGVSGDDYPCADNGQNCHDKIFAVSLSDPTVPVKPSGYITWFQALAACLNSRKRLPTNGEWQLGVQGTPDPGPDNGTTDCKTVGVDAVATGSRSSCVSAWEAYDMVGNLGEWVAQWGPRSTGCPLVLPGPGDDWQCLMGAETTGEPGALQRGGAFSDGSQAGPLTIFGTSPPSNAGVTLGDPEAFGFRCAR